MNSTNTPPPYVSWKKAFELGIPEVDEEHETFFEIINQLYAAMSRGAQTGYLQSCRARLQEYAAYHFKGEEDFLAVVGFPGLAGQRKEHAWFTKCIGELNLDSPDQARAALALAREWMLRHILGTDKHYAKWLAETKPEHVVELRRAS
jgi:hemerythrin